MIADFIAWLDHPRLTAPEVREREHAARYGYGTEVFEVTLEETVRRLHDGILPAVAAGLRAVFIAHPHTCRLEVVALPENDARILRVTRFRELATVPD